MTSKDKTRNVPHGSSSTFVRHLLLDPVVASSFFLRLVSFALFPSPCFLRPFSFPHPSLIHSFPPASLPTSCMMMMFLVFGPEKEQLNLNRKPLFSCPTRRKKREERRQRLYMVDSFKSYCLHLHAFIFIPSSSLSLSLKSLEFLGMLYCSLPEELLSQVLSLVWFPSLFLSLQLKCESGAPRVSVTEESSFSSFMLFILLFLV